MKLAVEFPSVSYREGPAAVAALARAIERIGYDHIDIFDHVVMGVPIEGRERGPYNPQMPILEALMGLAYMAAVTTRVTLGTEVLVLPQRQPTLVAKQVSTLDTLSGGRVRLGVGVGWQESEYEALGESFHDRGARMDEAIRLLRAYWTDAEVNMASAHYPTVSMAMEPKPPQGGRLPIWIGGLSEAAFRRVGRLGDGWLASFTTPEQCKAARVAIEDAADAAGRTIDPEHFGAMVLYTHDAIPHLIAQVIRTRNPDAEIEDVVARGWPNLRGLCERYVAMGFSKLVLVPLDAPRDWDEELAASAAEVLPIQG